MSPVALPALPAVAAVVAPALGTTPGPPWRRFARGAPRVAAFVVGMDIPLAVAGYLVVELATTLTRASVVLSGVTAVVLAGVGLRLLLRRGHGCSPAVVALAGRLLLGPQGARTFDITVGLALIVAAAYYAYRVLGGDVSTVPPGAPGSNVLP